VTFTLPYPPTTNHAYTVSRGRKIKTMRARQYATHVGYIVLAERVTLDLRGARLRVRIRVHAPDHRKRDLANVEKLAVDAVFAALDLDDSQIDCLTLVRGAVDPARPRLEFTVEERA
jgi:crossover junction endodeoxyribonuclease RusA